MVGGRGDGGIPASPACAAMTILLWGRAVMGRGVRCGCVNQGCVLPGFGCLAVDHGGGYPDQEIRRNCAALLFESLDDLEFPCGKPMFDVRGECGHSGDFCEVFDGLQITGIVPAVPTGGNRLTFAVQGAFVNVVEVCDHGRCPKRRVDAA